VKRVQSAGLLVGSVLKGSSECLKDLYTLGKKLGQGQFGTTYQCVEKTTGKVFACKSIAKRKLVSEDDVEDVRREIQIMHHLSGHPNIISVVGAYEDSLGVHLVMELCAGGELFDRIIQRGHYSERCRTVGTGDHWGCRGIPFSWGDAQGPQAREFLVCEPQGGCATKGDRFWALHLLQTRFSLNSRCLVVELCCRVVSEKLVVASKGES
jgi:hypothetical protein